MSEFLIIPQTECRWLRSKTAYFGFDEAGELLYSAEFMKPSREERWSDAHWILRSSRFILKNKSGVEVLITKHNRPIYTQKSWLWIH